MTSASGGVGPASFTETGFTFVLRDVHDVGTHHLRVWEPVDDTWLAEVAVEYRRLRTASRSPVEPLSFDGVDILDVSGVEKMLTTACVPVYQPGNFGVIRSDMAEIMLGLIQSAVHGSQFGYRSVRDRELVQLPGRGIDQIAVEMTEGPAGATIALVLGEAKVSTQAATPPSVVDTARDSLRSQHLGHLGDMATSRQKALDASRHAQDPQVAHALRVAALLLERGDGRASVVASSLMVRPKGRTVPDDFGSFHSDPDDYSPAHVRFMIVQLPGDIDQLAEQLGTLAAASGDGS